MGAIQSELPADPYEASLSSFETRSRTDVEFAIARAAVDEILGGQEYKFQLHVQLPGEHSSDELKEAALKDADLEDVYLAAEIVFAGLGAKVNPGKADEGEPAITTMAIPEEGAAERSQSMRWFTDRPA